MVKNSKLFELGVILYVLTLIALYISAFVMSPGTGSQLFATTNTVVLFICSVVALVNAFIEEPKDHRLSNIFVYKNPEGDIEVGSLHDAESRVTKEHGTRIFSVKKLVEIHKENLTIKK